MRRKREESAAFWVPKRQGAERATSVYLVNRRVDAWSSCPNGGEAKGSIWTCRLFKQNPSMLD